MIEAVEITATDGVVLRGELRLRGPDWVVLVHDKGEDLDAWRPLQPLLAEQKLSVLAFDLRGHGGSDAEPDAGQTASDLAATVAFIRERGAERVCIGAAGESVWAAIQVGGARRGDVVFLLAPVGDGHARPSVSRLTVASSFDPRQQAAARALHRGPGWSIVANVPVRSSGCGLVKGEWQANVLDCLRRFLKEWQRVQRETR